MAVAQDGLHHVERGLEGEEVLHAEAGAFDLDVVEGLAQVVVVAHGEGHTRLQQADELLGLLQALDDKGHVRGESHGLHPLQTHLADAVVGEHLADAGEADFLFEVGRVDHWLRVLRGAKVHKKARMHAFGLDLKMNYNYRLNSYI